MKALSSLIQRLSGCYISAGILASTHTVAFLLGIAACTGATLGVMAERGMLP